MTKKIVSAKAPREQSRYQKKLARNRQWRLRNVARERRRHREYYAKNRERLKAYARRRWRGNAQILNERRRRKHLRDPERRRVERRRYYKKYRGQLKAKQRAYYEANKHKHIASVARYNAEHRSQVRRWRRQQQWRRRARLAKSRGKFTEAEFQALCQKAGHRCAHCGRRRKLEPDHIIPVSRGGSNWISNIQPLCHPCNASKGNRLPTGVWETHRPRLP